MHAWADDLARALTLPRWAAAMLLAAVALSLLAERMRSNSAEGY